VERKRCEWRLRHEPLHLGERALVMGVIELGAEVSIGTPVEFEGPVQQALALQDAGADLIDLVPDPLDPHRPRPVEGEEIRRLVPVLKRLKELVTIPICVTTARAAVAAKATEHGASILHDPSGLTWEPDLAKAAVEANTGLILSHTRGVPADWPKVAPVADVTGIVLKELEASAGRAVRAGVERHRLALDPGLGQGKRREQNATLAAHLRAFHELALPLVVTASHRQLLPKQPDDFPVAAALVTAAVLSGCHVVRVHQAARMIPVVEAAGLIFAEIPSERVPKPPPARPPERDPRAELRRPPRPGMPSSR
jgi:dihydropteroate synthase